MWIFIVMVICMICRLTCSWCLSPSCLGVFRDLPDQTYITSSFFTVQSVMSLCLFAVSLAISSPVKKEKWSLAPKLWSSPMSTSKTLAKTTLMRNSRKSSLHLVRKSHAIQKKNPLKSHRSFCSDIKKNNFNGVVKFQVQEGKTHLVNVFTLFLTVIFHIRLHLLTVLHIIF